ncbi:hypothetical protein QQ008_11395 [Fulvivirgaceae bacterium BMA10]|uniref:Alpha/beta hydrolase n=1 Tax=Splendidivirga corallicola TaxID=3051826 RepID=A0ABT8KMN0_9BACT|nr:hypothetical protein [Fulvivirgaceae bacterium BMA10]
MRSLFVLVSLLSISSFISKAQTISASIPEKVDKNEKYIFYLHGGIVQDQGANAVSPYYGAYEYYHILDTLSNHGFNIISEVRPKDTKEEQYARKVSEQIDTLLNYEVPSDNITVVGASLGAYITIEIAAIRKSDKLRYAILGLCSEYALDYFSKYKNHLCGDFLSIYEKTDQKGSCMDILIQHPCKSGIKEIRLNMGTGHGFLYKPYPEWVHPLIDWINE